VQAFTRKFAGEEVLVIDNLRSNLVTYDIPAEMENTVWQDSFDDSTVTLPGVFEMQAYEFVVLRRK
jgi:hypothetical protein